MIMSKLLTTLFTLFTLSLTLTVSSSYAAEPELTIGTVERPPFMMKDKEGNLSGFSIELWKEISKRLGKTTQFKEFSTFSEMTSATQAGKVQASIANISITSKRETIMDYSQPIYDSGLQILISKKENKISYLQIIWDSGILLFILFAIGVLLVIAHILWFLERDIEDTRHDYFRDDYLGGIWDAFWWAFIVMTMGGFEKEVPHKISSRLLAMFWIMASLFFISTLTAKITTALTVSELKTSIASYKDLKGKRVGISAGPTARNFLAKQGVAVEKEYENLATLLNDLETGKLDAVVQDAPILQYYASHDGAGKVVLAGEVFKPEKYGILFPQGSALKEKVDQILIRLYEDGTYATLLKKYFESE
jgi:polar amino acid transport system substrate-binding protein